MTKQLIISKPNGDFTQPFTLREAHEVVKRQARRRGTQRDGWRLRMRGDEFGIVRHDLGETMERWEALARNHQKRGDVIVLDIIDHPYSVVARWIDTEPPVVATEGNHDIDIIYSWWHDQFPSSRNAGICVYKITGGSPSQHARWIDNNEEPGDGADASDEFLATMEDLKDASYEAVSQGKRFLATKGDDGIPLGRIIVGNQIWDPFQGWHPYGALYHYHAHKEGRWWLISGSATRC